MATHINKGVFRGHKVLLGDKYVTFEDEELPLNFDLYQKANDGFDWGHNGPASMQLAFSILYKVSDNETASNLSIRFTQEIVKKFNARSWALSFNDVFNWIKTTKEDFEIKPYTIAQKKSELGKTVKILRPKKDNLVKSICKELDITQKELATILDTPEETVNSWALHNEIPPIAKKAIEFYSKSTKNQKILDNCKTFLHILQAS